MQMGKEKLTELGYHLKQSLWLDERYDSLILENLVA
jgi:hypothetical protein